MEVKYETQVTAVGKDARAVGVDKDVNVVLCTNGDGGHAGLCALDVVGDGIQARIEHPDVGQGIALHAFIHSGGLALGYILAGRAYAQLHSPETGVHIATARLVVPALKLCGEIAIGNLVGTNNLVLLHVGVQVVAHLVGIGGHGAPKGKHLHE